VTENINKTAATAANLSEHSVGNGQTVQTDNCYNSSNLTWFLKVKKKTVFELNALTGKIFLLRCRTRNRRKEDIAVKT
jgi:hypothetical protein